MRQNAKAKEREKETSDVAKALKSAAMVIGKRDEIVNKRRFN